MQVAFVLAVAGVLIQPGEDLGTQQRQERFRRVGRGVARRHAPAPSRGRQRAGSPQCLVQRLLQRLVAGDQIL